MEFLSWFLNSLHTTLGGTKKSQSSKLSIVWLELLLKPRFYENILDFCLADGKWQHADFLTCKS